MERKNIRKEIDELGRRFYEERSEEAFNALYKILIPYYTAIMYKYYSNIKKYMIPDICTDTLVSIFKYIDSYKEGFSFYNYFSAIFTNHVLMVYRKQNKYHFLDNYDFDIVYTENEEDNIINKIDKETLLEILYDSLEVLNDLYKNIFIDKYIHDMKNPELMEKYDMNEQNIKNICFNVKSIMIYQMKEKLNIINPDDSDKYYYVYRKDGTIEKSIKAGAFSEDHRYKGRKIRKKIDDANKHMADLKKYGYNK